MDPLHKQRNQGLINYPKINIDSHKKERYKDKMCIHLREFYRSSYLVIFLIKALSSSKVIWYLIYDLSTLVQVEDY